MNKFVACGTAIATLLMSGAAFALPAGFTVAGSVGGAPAGVSYETFDGLALGTGSPQTTASGIVVTIMPDAAVAQGSSNGIYAAPVRSGSNGAAFGQGNGIDTTTYLVSGSTNASAGAAISLTFATTQQFFGLLWGSVDDFNTLSFYNGATLIGAITGSDVTASPSGDQGVNGTLYVNINSANPFNRVVATSRQYAFEFDDVSYNRTMVPEPMSIALLGTGLAGVGLLRRRRA